MNFFAASQGVVTIVIGREINTAATSFFPLPPVTNSRRNLPDDSAVRLFSETYNCYGNTMTSSRLAVIFI